MNYCERTKCSFTCHPWSASPMHCIENLRLLTFGFVHACYRITYQRTIANMIYPLSCISTKSLWGTGLPAKPSESEHMRSSFPSDSQYALAQFIHSHLFGKFGCDMRQHQIIRESWSFHLTWIFRTSSNDWAQLSRLASTWGRWGRTDKSNLRNVVF
jgi:hypothetical protein